MADGRTDIIRLLRDSSEARWPTIPLTPQEDLPDVLAALEREASAALRDLCGSTEAVRAHLVGSRLYGVALERADVDVVLEVSPSAQAALVEGNLPEADQACEVGGPLEAGDGREGE